jgi:tetratricopeptide (TPR) repeat protein
MSELRPDDGVACYELGKSYELLDQYDEALEAYLEASRREPDTAEYYYNAGLTYKQLRRYGKGAEMFRKVLQLEPDHAGAYKQWAASTAVSFLRQRQSAS